MNYEEKYEILKGLSPEISLMMRKPGDWYINCPSRYILNNGLFHGAFGNGKTPQEAIENEYNLYVIQPLKNNWFVCVYKQDKKYYRFENYMWREYSPEEVAFHTNKQCKR